MKKKTSFIGGIEQIRKIFSSMVSVVIIGYYGYFICTRWETLCGSLNLERSVGLMMGILIFLTWIANAFQAKLILDTQGLELGLIKNLFLIIASACGNYLPFRAGTLFRMYYLKKNFNYDYQSFGFLLLFRFLILFFVTGLLGLLCVCYISLHYDRFNIGLFFILTSVTALPVAVLFFHNNSVFIKGLKRCSRINPGNCQKGFRALTGNKKLILKLSCFIVFQIVLFSLRFYLSMVIIQSDIPFVILLFMSPIAILTSLLTITPGGVGMREGLLGMASSLTGYTFEAGVYIATIDRGILFFLTLAAGILSFMLLSFSPIKKQNVEGKNRII